MVTRAKPLLGLLGLVVALVGACDWTTFDSLENETWVKSTQTPSVGSTSYAVAIAPAAAAGAAPGGSLGVLGEASATYSTLIYDAKGGATVGSADQLSSANIEAFTQAPLFIADGMGDVTLIGKTNVANAYTITSGSGGSNALASVSLMASVPPDSATYAGSAIVVSAGPTLAILASGATTPVMCAGSDASGSAISFAALTSDATNVFGWTKTGDVVSATVTSVTGCTTSVAFTEITSTSLSPADGANLFLLGSGAAESLVAVGEATTNGSAATPGLVTVVPLSTPSAATSMEADGVQSAALGQLGSAGSAFLALGFPNATVEGDAAGDVELYAFDPNSSTPLTTTAVETLYCDDPDNGQSFGRSLAILPYNGTTILSVAANNEVFTYFRTQQYGDTRQ